MISIGLWKIFKTVAIILIVVSDTSAAALDSTNSTIEEKQEKVLNVLKLLFDKGLDVNVTDTNGFTALHNFISSKNEKYAIFLIENGANVQTVTKYGESLIHLAIKKSSSSELIELLLKKGVDVNAKNKNGNTALQWVIKNSNLRSQKTILVVKMLLENGADPNLEDNNGGSVWKYITEKHYDMSVRSVPVLTLLVENGVDINTTDDKGHTLLYHSLLFYIYDYSNFVPIIKLYVKNGADIQSKRNTLLQYSIERLDYETINFFLNHGADLKQIPNIGYLVSHWISKGEIPFPMMELLIRNGFDINVKLPETLLYLSINNSNWEFTTYLINHGANIEGTNGELYLRLAASKKGSIPFMKFLLEKGVDINAKDENGLTALHHSISHDYDNFNFLLENGADVLVLTNSNKSLFHHISEKV